jgi:hypothetical protein
MHRWDNNITMYLQEMGYGAIDLIDQAQDRDRFPAVVNAIMKIRVLYNAGNFLTN